jgi:hypothetical protein
MPSRCATASIILMLAWCSSKKSTSSTVKPALVSASVSTLGTSLVANLYTCEYTNACKCRQYVGSILKVCRLYTIAVHQYSVYRHVRIYNVQPPQHHNTTTHAVFDGALSSRAAVAIVVHCMYTALCMHEECHLLLCHTYFSAIHSNGCISTSSNGLPSCKIFLCPTVTKF